MEGSFIANVNLIAAWLRSLGGQLPQYDETQDYGNGAIISIPDVGLVESVDPDGSGGAIPSEDDGTHWLNVIGVHFVATGETQYGIPLREGTLIIDIHTKKRYMAKAVLAAYSTIADGLSAKTVLDVSEVDWHNFLHTMNKWYRPQRTTGIAQPFSANISLGMNISNDIGVTLGAGAYAIENPHADNILVEIHELDPLLGIGHILDNTTYTIYIENTSEAIDTFQYTTGTGATAEEIMAGFTSLINDPSTGSDMVTATDLLDGTMNLEVNVPGTSYELRTDVHLFYSVQGQGGYMIFDGEGSSTEDPIVSGDWFDFGTQGPPTGVAGKTYALAYYVRKFAKKGIWARCLVSEPEV
jgi:hypothetical protein